MTSAVLLLPLLDLGAGLFEMMSGGGVEALEGDSPTDETVDDPVHEADTEVDEPLLDEPTEPVVEPAFEVTVPRTGADPEIAPGTEFGSIDLSDPEDSVAFDFGEAEGFIHIVRWNAETDGETLTEWFTELGIFYSESAEQPDIIWREWDPDDPFPGDEEIENFYDPSQANSIGTTKLGSDGFDKTDTISDDCHFLNDDRRDNDDPDIDFDLPVATVIENPGEYSYLSGRPAEDFPLQKPHLLEVTVDVPDSEGGGTEEIWNNESVLLHDGGHGGGFRFVEDLAQIVHVVDLNAFADETFEGGVFANSDLSNPDALVIVPDSTDPPLDLGTPGWRFVGTAETVSVVKGGSDVRDNENNTDSALDPPDIVSNVPVATNTFQSLSNA